MDRPHSSFLLRGHEKKTKTKETKLLNLADHILKLYLGLFSNRTGTSENDGHAHLLILVYFYYAFRRQVTLLLRYKLSLSERAKDKDVTV